MKGKADMLVANRTLSALVVVCLVVSAFAGLLVLMVSTPRNVQAASLGDLTINGPYTIENIVQPVDGNVTVTATGNLTIRDATLSIMSNYAPSQRRTITVQAGGVLYLEHGTITTYLDQINPWPFLDLVVQGASSHLIATGQSVLMFPGHIYLNPSSHVILRDTQIVSLPDTEVAKYVVGSAGLITFDSANDGPEIQMTDATLEMYDSSITKLPEYPNDGTLASNITLAGTSVLVAVNSYIGIDFGPTLVTSNWYTHNSLVLTGSAQAELYGCTFEPYVGNEADRRTAIVASGSEGAHIYRWINVTVGDAYGVPIPGANVDAVFTGSTYSGNPAFYFLPSGLTQPLPPVSVLNYMGKTALTFGTTGTDGIAKIPLITDLITGPLGPNPIYIGTYQLNGSAVINLVPYSSTEIFSFVAYPAMGPADRNFDFTVEITGVSAPSPDQSKWLVVPVSPAQPNLTIEGMTYYHAGDVIVASGGILTFDNSVFELVQAYPNQRTVYVDGTALQPGKLIFERSTMNSAVGINIIVKGYATLEVLNSTFNGVSIIALENSHVILKNASIDQQISTAWNSHASIIVKDSTLIQPMVLSGYSIGGFTNTSVPSIRVTDSAQATIYRWIHVIVYDGAGKPLPNANVSAYYLVNNTFATSALTSSDPLTRGIAQVNAYGTIIRSGGSDFVGNYKVVAFYTWGSPVQYYWSDSNISVGVMPYSEPLEKNATYDTMTISSAVPHLFVNQAMGPIESSPVSPARAEPVLINATVNNSGPVGAYNVKVDFYDNGILFDVVYIPEVLPGNSSIATAHWIAPTPVNQALTPHNISFVADSGINNTVPVTGWGTVSVQALPDIVAPGIRLSAAYPEVDKPLTIFAVIRNDGDHSASDVTVVLKSDTVPIYTTVVPLILAGASVEVNTNWTFATATDHILRVESSTAAKELDPFNNNATLFVTVYPHPDLQLSDIVFTPLGPVSGGATVRVQAELNNLETVPISSPKLRLDVTGTGVPTFTQNTTLTSVTNLRLGHVIIETSFTAPVLNVTTVVTVQLTINPDGTIAESNPFNNVIFDYLTVQDVRPDLSIIPGGITLARGTTVVTAEEFGRAITITANAQNLNLGGQPIKNPGFTAQIGVRLTNSTHLYNRTLFNITDIEIGSNSTNHSAKIVNTWDVSVTSPGTYQIWVFLDPENTIGEPSKTNNFAAKGFTLNNLSMNVQVLSSSGDEFKAGDLVMVSGTFTYTDNGNPVKLLPGVQFWLVDAVSKAKLANANSTIVKSDSDGLVVTSIRVPANTPSGKYLIVAEVPDAGGPYESELPIHVSAAKAPGLLPTWAWMAIIAGAVAVVLGFLGYTYKYGLGKLVECGECGAFIPAASKRCPKCGVEFEVGTMKCSECGAWIPAESTECPNCGVKFVGETEDDTDYLERMKKEYEEMTSKYRELAKGELGKKFSERDFDDWFKRQPGYISFDDWLAKEEEKKLEGPIPCKVCGTLNPKEATVCHKCGTVFSKEQPPKKAQPPQGGEPAKEEAVTEQPSAQPQAQPQPAAPRMVIRRPIDRKVVPKKIIKSPVNGETEDQTQQQQ